MVYTNKFKEIMNLFLLVKLLVFTLYTLIQFCNLRICASNRIFFYHDFIFVKLSSFKNKLER